MTLVQWTGNVADVRSTKIIRVLHSMWRPNYRSSQVMTWYSLVVAEQPRVETKFMSVVADEVNRSICILFRSMFAV